MINKGDKIICIFPDRDTITVGKIYTVIGLEWHKKASEKLFSNVYIVIINDCGWKAIFKFKDNFITLAEWRDNQINSILND
jgi:hypothetical protein